MVSVFVRFPIPFTDSVYIQDKKVVVFYGSQTGTAEEFAARLAKEATRHGMPAMTFDPEECTDWVHIQYACTALHTGTLTESIYMYVCRMYVECMLYIT